GYSLAKQDFADGSFDGSAVFNGLEGLAFFDVPFYSEEDVSHEAGRRGFKERNDVRAVQLPEDFVKERDAGQHALVNQRG
ncbi:MAG: hypothetical protein Q9200_004835, partial [Gallowayella weberi]